jgi:hypothetical protein
MARSQLADVVWTRTRLARPHRRCSAIGETPSANWAHVAGGTGRGSAAAVRAVGGSDALHVAAFTAPDHMDWDAFERRWSRLRADETVLARVIVVDDDVAGTIGSRGEPGERRGDVLDRPLLLGARGSRATRADLLGSAVRLRVFAVRGEDAASSTAGAGWTTGSIARRGSRRSAQCAAHAGRRWISLTQRSQKPARASRGREPRRTRPIRLR